MLKKTADIIKQFLKASHPFVIVVPDHDFEGDDEVFLHDLMGGDDAYDTMALMDSPELVIYCADQQSVDNLGDILREMNISFYNFIS